MRTALLDERGNILWISDITAHRPRPGGKLWEWADSTLEKKRLRRAVAVLLVSDKSMRLHVKISRKRFRVEMTPVRQGRIICRWHEVPDVTLSPREEQILRMICEDLKPNEIAQRLRLSVHTVDTYRQTLRAKLKSIGTAGMVRWAIRAGLIDP
jgi:DNA-binding CsgD family transcriptional regulator